MKIGDRIITSMGETLILDVHDDYLVLFRLDGPEFVKANGYEYENGKLWWLNGEYYSTLEELYEGIYEVEVEVEDI